MLFAVLAFVLALTHAWRPSQLFGTSRTRRLPLDPTSSTRRLPMLFTSRTRRRWGFAWANTAEKTYDNEKKVNKQGDFSDKSSKQLKREVQGLKDDLEEMKAVGKMLEAECGGGVRLRRGTFYWNQSDTTSKKQKGLKRMSRGVKQAKKLSEQFTELSEQFTDMENALGALMMNCDGDQLQKVKLMADVAEAKMVVEKMDARLERKKAKCNRSRRLMAFQQGFASAQEFAVHQRVMSSYDRSESPDKVKKMSKKDLKKAKKKLKREMKKKKKEIDDFKCDA